MRIDWGIIVPNNKRFQGISLVIFFIFIIAVSIGYRVYNEIGDKTQFPREVIIQGPIENRVEENGGGLSVTGYVTLGPAGAVALSSGSETVCSVKVPAFSGVYEQWIRAPKEACEKLKKKNDETVKMKLIVSQQNLVTFIGIMPQNTK